MLAIFGYSLAGLALALYLSRNLPRRSRLLLALMTLLLLNGPTLLTVLFYR
jgi:hypothetical protein